MIVRPSIKIQAFEKDPILGLNPMPPLRLLTTDISYEFALEILFLLPKERSLRIARGPTDSPSNRSRERVAGPCNWVA